MGRPLLQIKPGMAADGDFVREINANEGAHRRRLWTFWNMVRQTAESDITRADYAFRLGISTRELRRWIHAYNTYGVYGLADRPRRHKGRKPPVWAEKLRPLINRIYNQGEDCISIKELHGLVINELGIQIKYSTLAKHVNRMGIRGRPKAEEKIDFAKVLARLRQFGAEINEQLDWLRSNNTNAD